MNEILSMHNNYYYYLQAYSIVLILIKYNIIKLNFNNINYKFKNQTIFIIQFYARIVINKKINSKRYLYLNF